MPVRSGLYLYTCGKIGPKTDHFGLFETRLGVQLKVFSRIVTGHRLAKRNIEEFSNLADFCRFRG